MQRHAKPVVMMSLEMTRADVYKRAISQLGPVNMSSLAHGGQGVGADEWQRIAKARGLMSDLRFAVDDRSSVTVADIRAAVTRCKRRHGSCGLLVVDYLQLVAPSGRHENRQTEVASISRALKIAAKEHDVPLLLLAQLNRAPEGAARPPRPSDLRESGAVEQDSDVVILLHRDAEKSPDVLEVGVGKNRHGPTGAFRLRWEGHYSRVTPEKWSPSGVLGAAS
jgi:replicative DNA helicase